MTSKTLCAWALCLLSAGCGIPGGSSRGPLGAAKWFPARPRPSSSNESFAKAVQKDPFPRADQTGLRVGKSAS